MIETDPVPARYLREKVLEYERLFERLQDARLDLLDPVPVRVDERVDGTAHFAVGWDEITGLYAAQRLQAFLECLHIVDEGDLVLFQNIFAEQAVAQIEDGVRREDADHVDKMAGKRNEGERFRAFARVYQARHLRRLGLEEFRPQLLEWETAPEKAALEVWIFYE